MIAARSAPIDAARSALGRGDMAAAARAAAAAMAENPGNAEGHFLFGISQSAAGRIQSGIDHVSTAVAIDPQGAYRAQLARLFSLARRDGEAAATLHAAEAAPPADAHSRDTMGCVYARLGNHRAALGHFTEAVRLRPGNPEYCYNQAVTLNFLGRTDEAETALEALLASAPGHARAHHLLSALRKQSAARNHVDRLRRNLTQARGGRDRLLLGYALAKELEDIGEPDEALDTLCIVNAEHRRTLPYSFARDAACFYAIAKNWPAIRSAPADGAPDEAPIFIIGMPRTGTTLVDRIVASHPDVTSAGELQAMPLAIKKAAGTRSATVLDADTIAAASSVDLAAIGRDYLQRASHHRRESTLRFTDKFPGNFHYVGFIARALPAARIVCLRRHPMDTVLSNFRNLFAISSRYYDYSYDLLETAAYYARFDQLMALWSEALPGRVLEVRYEDLVADQEGQTRRLLSHCGLGWSDRCLAFHSNDSPVSTPSAAQVRRPIYSDSVARWKRHGALLKPVRQFFEQNGVSIE